MFLVPALAIDRTPLKRPFVEGVVVGWVANLFIFRWLWQTFAAAQIGVVTTIGCWLLLSLVLSLYVGAFFEIVRAVRDWPAAPLIAGAAWVALDELRSVVLTGFPWALLAHTQAH